MMEVSNPLASAIHKPSDIKVFDNSIDLMLKMYLANQRYNQTYQLGVIPR